MPDAISTGVNLVKDALRLEKTTRAGNVNLVSVTLAFIVVLVGGAADLAQVIIRIWRPHYTTGLPDALTLFLVYIVMASVCVLLLLLLDEGRS